MDSFSAFSKRFLPLVIVLSLVVVFHKPIEILLDATFVKFALAYVEHSWYCDLIVIGVAAFFIVNAGFKLWRRYVPNDNLSLLLFGLVGYYAYYRFFDNHWDFTPFSFSSCLYYADISFVVFLATVIHYLRRKKKDNSKPSFYNDEPLKKDGNDELGYKNYAQDLAAKLENSWFETSFAVGINGKWGVGKTSFVTLLRSELSSKKDIIEVEFNPWRSSTPDAIVNDFFLAFSSALSPYHSGVSRLISIYMQRMSDLSGSSLLQSLSFVSNLTHNSKAIGDLHQDINDALKTIDKKIVVYIDDIDRLYYDEVLEVLRLIRNTANFRNTTFVVAYDRDYLASAIKSRIDCNTPQYIEKIFQLEITLPYYDKELLRKKLAENLKDYLEDKDYTWIKGDRSGRFSFREKFPMDWLHNLRDVTRISNSIVLNYSKLKSDVVFEEFFKLELLHVKYPSVYELIFRSKEYLFEDGILSDNSSCIRVRFLSRGNPNHPDKDKTCLKDFLEKNSKLLLISQNEISMIVDLVVRVFDNKGKSLAKNNQSVIFPSKFPRYFSYCLKNRDLSRVEFSRARGSDQYEFTAKILNWIEDGMEQDVVESLMEIRTFDDRRDFEKIVWSTFFVASQKSKLESKIPNQFIGYDGDVLYSIVEEDFAGKRFYKGNNDVSDYRKFILSLVENERFSAWFRVSFIQKLKKRVSPSFPITQEEMDVLILKCFKQYCENTHVLDFYFWRLFGVFDTQPSSSDSLKSYSPEAVAIAKQFLIGNVFDDFLIQCIQKSPYALEYGISQSCVAIVGSLQELESVVMANDNDRWINLSEFRRFFEAYKENGYKDVAFDFSEMPIDR